MIFYQGGQSASKIRKICEAFNCNVYPCPDTPLLRKDLTVEVHKRIAEVRTVLEATQQHRRQVTDIVERNAEMWTELLVKEKGIYHTMNLFEYDNGRKCLIAEGWCPSDSLEAITAALRAGKVRHSLLSLFILPPIISLSALSLWSLQLVFALRSPLSLIENSLIPSPYTEANSPYDHRGLTGVGSGGLCCSRDPQCGGDEGGAAHLPSDQ